ncbi:MAG: TetR/AcrR family transcriptional regulator [Leptospirales bacterium]|nr:TetR/AcrR family transcriptional regulator [Leptospirales bacterium]
MAKDSYHHGDLRAALVAAATEFIAESGYEALTIRETARRVGVSHNAPYRHFADREALLAAVAVQAFADLEQALLETQKATGARQGLLQLARCYMRFALANPQRYELMWKESLFATPDHALLEQASMRCFLILQGAVRQLHPRISDSTGADMAVAHWAAVHGLLSLQQMGHLHFLKQERSAETLLLRILERIQLHKSV